MAVKIVRTALYIRSLKKLGARAAEIAALEASVSANPLAGDVIPGLGGVRKMRFAMAGKGKRGGGWAIYYAVWRGKTVFMIWAYSKSVQEDLSSAQRQMVMTLLEAIKRDEA